MMIFKRFRLILFFLFFLSTTNAQQQSRLINNWEFIRQDLSSIWEAVRPIPKAGAETVPLWQQIILPHCINAEDAVDPDVNYYQGPAWYRTKLTITNPYSNGRTLLHFEGAGQKTQVYVYTTLVGSHVGGYDEFTIDITAAVDSFKKKAVFQKQFNGTIPISIRTDNSRDAEMMPSSLSDFTIYGGIYRYLNLVYVPSLSLEKLFIAAETDSLGKKGKLTITPRFYNPNKESVGNITYKLFDPAGKMIRQLERKDATTNSSPVEFSITKPSLWSPDKPSLYTIEASVGDYKQTEKIGFRQYSFLEKGPFLLNGKRLLLQGTHRHEDWAGVGSALTEEMMREEMLLIKQMGVNFIRLGHYQQSRIILNLCDSLGILVWEEIPWCRGGIGGEVYKEQGRRMLTNMIEQHYNHPSIIIWGLGNENDWPNDFSEFDTLKIRNYMRELNALSHKLDPSRKTAIRRCDFCKDIVDVYSPSIWAGWYRGIYTEYKEISLAEMQKVNHFLHVEWGGDSHAGRHSENPDKGLQSIKATGNADEKPGDAALFGGAARASKDGNWNESYICNLIDWHLKEQETMPWLTGSAQWTFKDFATPLRPENPVPYVNQKGVVERDLTKKESYYVFQSYWSKEPMVHIYGHTWPVRWGDANEPKMIKVYSNCDEAELFLNGKSYGKKKRVSWDFPAAGLRWNVPMNKGAYDVKVIAVKGKTIVKDSIHFEYQTEKWGKPAKVLLEKIKEENGIATIQIKLLDEKNVVCLDSANYVRFGLTGAGKLIDNQGTSSGSRYVQLYNGRAIIRVKMNDGISVISVKVDNVPDSFLNLEKK